MAEFAACYHVGRMMKEIPRFFAVQTGRNQDGSVDFGRWFENEGLLACADMKRGNYDKLRAHDNHQKACARNGIIFKVCDFVCERQAGLEALDPISQRFLARKKEQQAIMHLHVRGWLLIP